MIYRYLEDKLIKSLKPGLVVGIFGARRTGKTFLMNEIQKKIKKGKVLMVSGENLDVAEILSSQRLNVIKKMLDGYKYLFVDEAQKIPNIGLNLKLIVDNIKNISIFVTGSSAFSLKNKIGEPLVGRSKYFSLYPIAQIELKEQEDYLSTKDNLEERLVFGSYPQVVTARTKNEKMDFLQSIRDGYLLKDILELENLKDSLFIFNLLRLIAFQIGNDISYSELASNLNVSKKTVMRYLELLEKNYIIFSLHGFSKNLRKEYTKSPRFYFWDNGIRNCLISNYNNLNLRDDIGKLWENYCIVERIKKNEYKRIRYNKYFWRTYDLKEIDYIEERQGGLYGYEFKWSESKKVKIPRDWKENYKKAKFKVVNRGNYLDFII